MRKTDCLSRCFVKRENVTTKRVVKMPSAHKIELQIVSPSGEPLGLVIVGIPEDQFLKLKAEFPDKGFSGQRPKVNQAIKEGITKQEKDHIAKHPGLPGNTKLKFQFEGIPRSYVDEAKEKPSFESHGKKFWIKSGP